MPKFNLLFLPLSALILPSLLCAAPSLVSLANTKAPQLQRVSAISPLRFEPNLGQADPQVRYIARGSGYMLMLAGQEAVMLRPGAEPNQIRLAYSGADSMRLDFNGDLILNVQGKERRQRRPLVYQEIDGKRVEVTGGCFAGDGGYELTKRTEEVRFAIASYDRAKPLIVDRVLVYSKYLGGSGVNQGPAIAVDSTGAAYVAGSTTGGFPTLNACQNTYGGCLTSFQRRL
jgi:hypothetical protein